MISPAQLGELKTSKEVGIFFKAVAQKWRIDVISLVFLVVWFTPATILLLNVHLTLTLLLATPPLMAFAPAGIFCPA